MNSTEETFWSKAPNTPAGMWGKTHTGSNTELSKAASENAFKFPTQKKPRPAASTIMNTMPPHHSRLLGILSIVNSLSSKLLHVLSAPERWTVSFIHKVMLGT